MTLLRKLQRLNLLTIDIVFTILSFKKDNELMSFLKYLLYNIEKDAF
jgi:hypothetical protein